MYKKILVPVDGSPASMRGLREALRVAKAHKSKLRLLHVVGIFVPTPAFAGGIYLADVEKTLRASGRRVLARAEAAVRRQRIAVDSVMFETVGGRAADVIVSHAAKWRAGLIVIGTHGRRGLRRVALGSDAEQVIRTSPVPVLVVRPHRASRG